MVWAARHCEQGTLWPGRGQLLNVMGSVRRHGSCGSCNRRGALFAVSGWLAAALCLVMLMHDARPSSMTQGRGAVPPPCPALPRGFNTSAEALQRMGMMHRGTQQLSMMQRSPLLRASDWSVFEKNETRVTLNGFADATSLSVDLHRAPRPDGGAHISGGKRCTVEGFQTARSVMDLLCIFESEEFMPASSWSVGGDGGAQQPLAQLVDTSLEQDYYAKRCVCHACMHHATSTACHRGHRCVRASACRAQTADSSE